MVADHDTALALSLSNPTNTILWVQSEPNLQIDE